MFMLKILQHVQSLYSLMSRMQYCELLWECVCKCVCVHVCKTVWGRVSLSALGMPRKSLVILMKALPVSKPLGLISYRWRERQKTPIRIFHIHTNSQQYTNTITFLGAFSHSSRCHPDLFILGWFLHINRHVLLDSRCVYCIVTNT